MAQDLIEQGLAAENELFNSQTQAFMPDAPSELEFVDGVTADAFQKWTDLKSFAEVMQHNYNINVSRPDARNPLAMQAHQAYKKGLADIQYTLDMLKQGRKTQMLDEQAARLGQVTLHDRPANAPSNMVDPRQRFTSTAINPMVEQQNAQSRREFYTDREFNQAMNQYLAEKAQYQRFAEADPANAEYWRRQEAALIAPIRSTHPEFFREQNKTTVDVTPAINELNQIRSLLINGDVAGTTRLMNKDVARITRERSGAGMKVHVYYKGGGKDIIDLNGAFGGLDQINELRNKNISADRRLDTRQIMPYIQQMASDPAFAKYNEPTDQFQLKYLTEGIRQWNTKPGNLSTIQIDGVNIANKQEFLQNVKGTINNAIKNMSLYMPNSNNLVDKFEVDKKGNVTLMAVDEAHPDSMPIQITYDLNNVSDVAAMQQWLAENADVLFTELGRRSPSVAPVSQFENGYTNKGRGATFKGSPAQSDVDAKMQAARDFINSPEIQKLLKKKTE